MRILTVRQPWAHAIVHLGKDVENRTRNIAGDYRGPVAIHAGLATFEEEGGAFPQVQRAIWLKDEGYSPTDSQLWEVAEAVDPGDPRFVYGAVIGVVDLVDVHRGYQQDDPYAWEPDEYCDIPSVIGPHPKTCSTWAEANVHHLVLANPRPLADPIAYKGALGLRTLDDATVGRVLEGIA